MSLRRSLPAPSVAPGRGDTPSDIVQALNNACAALEAGSLGQALRWADRAQRRCPGSPEIAELKGRVLAGLGAHEAALDEYLTIDRDGWTAAGHALLAETFLALGRDADAFDVLRTALARFAVSPDDPLAACASRACELASVGAPVAWIGVAPDLRLWGGVGRNVADDDLALSLAGMPLGWQRAEGDGVMSAFTVADDVTTLDGILYVTAAGAVLGDGLAFPPDFAIDARCRAVDGLLQGWVRSGWFPEMAPTLVVRDRLRIVARGAADMQPDGAGRHAFRFSIPRFCWGGELTVEAELPDGRSCPLPTSPSVVSLPRSPGARRFGRRRRGGGSPALIDIIIPVYAGREETMDCLQSVLASGVDAARVILIDDASPDPDMSAALASFAEREGATLLINRRNLGFPASVNRGLRLHPTHDVVILNADAEVYPGWLERLRDAAYAADDVGTATPLSNAGAIASYPLWSVAPPSAREAAALDAFAAVANAGERVEAPTGVGFCLYVRRACLDAVGDLDARLFGRGYGEENDFCLRATARGWRHLIATDVFVRHRQSRSFGVAGAPLRDRNGELLARRHSAYRALVEDFIACDPLGPARRRLDEARLRAIGGRVQLLVSLTSPGGVDRVIEQRSDDIAAADGVAIVLRPEPDPARVRLAVHGIELDDLVYEVATERNALLDFLRALRPETLELHHFLDHDASLIGEMIETVGNHIVYLHDYSWICPRLTLLGGAGRYCGEPDLDGCARCVATNGSLLGDNISVTELRARSGRWLSAADRVIAPSRDTRARYRRHFPDLDIDVAPWETETFGPALAKRKVGKPVKVAVIGAIGEQKGYSLLRACARDAAERLLPIEFVVIGFTVDDAEWLALGNSFVTGRFEEEDVDALIRREAPDVALFASVTPETHCFSLTHALRAGLAIVAFDIGAIAERLRDAASSACLLPIDADVAVINTALLTLARDVHGGAATRRAIPAPVTASIASPMTERDLGGDDTMRDAVAGLTASPQLFVLEPGIFSISLQVASPRRFGPAPDMMLPALHVTPAPGGSGVEIVSGLRAEGAWLYEASDAVVVKVTEAGSTILITSYSAAGLMPLAIEIAQINAPRIAEPARRVALHVDAHVAMAGDMVFAGTEWTGALTEQLPIEAFAIRPVERVAGLDIEYKAVTVQGEETPWIGGGRVCGLGGQAIALAGFAVRLTGSAAVNFGCRYQAKFGSGVCIGPLEQGAPAYGIGPDDPLIGFRLEIVQNGAAIPRSVTVPAERRPAPQPVNDGSTGPRFGVYRLEAR